jgi:hypothetical protein
MISIPMKVAWLNLNAELYWFDSTVRLAGIVTLVGGVTQAQFPPSVPIIGRHRGQPFRAGIALGFHLWILE